MFFCCDNVMSLVALLQNDKKKAEFEAQSSPMEDIY